MTQLEIKLPNLATLSFFVLQLIHATFVWASYAVIFLFQALFAIRRVLLAQHTAFPVSGADLYEELLSSTAILSTGNPR